MACLRVSLRVRAALSLVHPVLLQCLRPLARAAFGLAFCCAALPAAAAGNVAGDFGFYVLSLSWAPSYCASAGAHANRQECGRDARYGFIVHGLWPQNANGYPESCPSKFASRVPLGLGRKYFDIMPGMSLIGHEWRVHGTCTGLDQASYFRLVRKALEAVRVPSEFRPAAPARSIDPARVEAAFIAANPGISQDGIAVTCKDQRIEEVRICLTKSLRFRSCPRVDAAACNRPRASMPKAGRGD